MEISSQCFSRQGKRQNNEDSIKLNTEAGLFIVCDGVGGNKNGEVASELATNTINDCFGNDSENDVASIISEAIKKTEIAMKAFSEQNAESKGMATTLALLKLDEATATVAHIGDSRVYHIRDGKICFRTQDHSLVNELVASGFITEKHALHHPKRNVITRAIQADNEYSEADINFVENIEVGDYFMLCSDGVLEAIGDDFIEQNFLQEKQLGDITALIEKQCEEHSYDNYSGIFIRINSL
ncbi:MAG: serine/threonine-protein phosphatase [Bacteroidetes bacterium]|nr:serine/threonine-protein phosphatase [Bacteroidota bacterium]